MNLTFSPTQHEALKKLATARGMMPDDFVKALVLEAISPPTITIKQVAEVARVSMMTASYALNNVPGQVSETTRKRIKAIAKKIGYRQSMTAQSLRRKRV